MKVEIDEMVFCWTVNQQNKNWNWRSFFFVERKLNKIKFEIDEKNNFFDLFMWRNFFFEMFDVLSMSLKIIQFSIAFLFCCIWTYIFFYNFAFYKNAKHNRFLFFHYFWNINHELYLNKSKSSIDHISFFLTFDFSNLWILAFICVFVYFLKLKKRNNYDWFLVLIFSK